MVNSERMTAAFRSLKPSTAPRNSPTQEIERRASEAQQRWPLLASTSGDDSGARVSLEPAQKQRRMQREAQQDEPAQSAARRGSQMLGALAGLRDARGELATSSGRNGSGFAPPASRLGPRNAHGAPGAVSSGARQDARPMSDEETVSVFEVDEEQQSRWPVASTPPEPVPVRKAKTTAQIPVPLAVGVPAEPTPRAKPVPTQVAEPSTAPSVNSIKATLGLFSRKSVVERAKPEPTPVPKAAPRSAKARLQALTKKPAPVEIMSTEAGVARVGVGARLGINRR